jgi:hypothetical protein
MNGDISRAQAALLVWETRIRATNLTIILKVSDKFGEFIYSSVPPPGRLLFPFKGPFAS